MTKPKTNSKEPPDPEVRPRASRRRFSTNYKIRILQEADQCQAGEMNALLRREGLFSSHLSKWRKQREQGLLVEHPESKANSRADTRIRELTTENQRLRAKLDQAQKIIEVQKKLCNLLDPPSVDGEN